MNPTEPSSIMPLVEAVHAGFSISNTILSFIILGVLLMLSAMASGSESAFFSLGPNEKEKLKNDNSKSSQAVLQLLENPKELLATLLITNNFVNVGVVILSSSILNDLYPITGKNDTFRFLLEIVGITFAILMIGEVIPKIWSSKNSLAVARMMAIPINTIKSIPPLSWLKKFLVNGTNFIYRRARRKGVKITTDELEQALALTKEKSTSDEEHKILEGIIRFGTTDTRQIMKSRLDVVAIDHEINFKGVLDVILEAGYSRMPVYRDSFDNVIGILYIKDLLPHLAQSEDFKWNELIRKPFFVPENKKIDDLLKEFQEMKMHMAIVVDEYGGSCGVITLEDILEEIVGDITDEFDDDEIVYTKINDKTYLFEGRTALVDFYKVLDIDGKEFDQQKGDSETLGGFIVEHAGRILKNNEFIIFENIKLIVESSDKRRIKMIKIVLLEPNDTK
jgi:gliding motility-associated protein GldE